MSYLVRGSILTAGLAALVWSSGAAAAQTGSAPPPPPARVGAEIGFGLYGGEINCENENSEFCNGVTEAGGFDVHANYFFVNHPQWGLTVDIWPMFHTDENWTFTHTVAVIGAKFRPVPILTFTAGLGSAQARLNYKLGPFEGEARTDTVPAVMVAAGLELVRGRSFALDVQARLGIGFYEEDEDNDGQADVVGRNVGLGAALTFF